MSPEQLGGDIAKVIVACGIVSFIVGFIIKRVKGVVARGRTNDNPHSN